MKKFINRLLSNRIAALAAIAVFFLITFSGILYLTMGREATASLTQQYLDRQMSVTEMGASSMTSYIELTGRSLVHLAEDDHIVYVNNNTKEWVQAYVDDWSTTPLMVIFRFDSEGNRIIAVSSDRTVEYKEVVNKSEQVCIGSAETFQPGEVCFTDVHIPGDKIDEHFGFMIGMVTPIYVNDQFDGSLLFGISLNKLTEFYLDNLRITDGSVVTIITSEGNVLYSSNPDYIGKNLLELLKDNVFLGSPVLVDKVEQVLTANEAGSGDLALPKPLGSRVSRMLLAYAPIQIDGGHMMLVVRTPYSEALKMAAPFYVSNIAIVIVVFLALLLLVVVIVKNVAYREGFIGHGKMHGEKQEKSEKDLQKIVEK